MSYSVSLSKATSVQLKRSAKTLAGLTAEYAVGDVVMVSSAWMYREKTEDQVAFPRPVTEYDLLFRNRMVAWDDDKEGITRGSYQSNARFENVSGDGSQSHVTACRYTTNGGRNLIALRLRDETFSPSRAVRFIDHFCEVSDAASYNFDTTTYDRFVFYEVAYDCDDAESIPNEALLT